jgi:hypothetical protein
MRNITLSADDHLIEKAREKAARQKRSLNDAFREWLATYAEAEGGAERYQQLMERLSYALPGRHFTRDEMNER